MHTICLDLETFFDHDYTLKKQTLESYVRSNRFHALGCAVRDACRHSFSVAGIACEQIEPSTLWVPHDLLPDLFRSYDWRDTAVVCHHAQFDGLILAHHYQTKPAFWFDTLSMARLALGNHVSAGLGSLATHFGLKPKSVPYDLFKGKKWDEIEPIVQRAVAAGGCHDTALTWEIFGRLIRGFPAEELEVIDATVRMYTEPALQADLNLLAQIWQKEDADKKIRMDNLGVTAADLQSSDRFAGLLRGQGIVPPRKAGKNGAIYPFAKTDQFMRDLLEHPDQNIRALAEARLGVKSTLMQTRAETWGWMGKRGALPIYLKYAGAHTTRWSGGDGQNAQNFPRGSDLRKAIMAPEGYLLAAIDLSQIEARMLLWLAEQTDALQRFVDGDPYVEIASRFYGRPVTKADKSERGTGKQLVLSCGYGCGADKFRATAKLGLYGPPVELSSDAAANAVKLYRQSHPKVVRYWRQADRILQRLAADETTKAERWGPFVVCGKVIFLPNGAPLIYGTLEKANGEWHIKTRTGYMKMYGAKLVENVTSALARLVLSQAMLRIKKLGYKIATCTHDEVLVLIPKDGKEQAHVDACVTEMQRTPDWAPGLPLAAEATLGERYAK